MRNTRGPLRAIGDTVDGHRSSLDDVGHAVQQSIEQSVTQRSEADEFGFALARSPTSSH